MIHAISMRDCRPGNLAHHHHLIIVTRCGLLTGLPQEQLTTSAHPIRQVLPDPVLRAGPAQRLWPWYSSPASHTGAETLLITNQPKPGRSRTSTQSAIRTLSSEVESLVFAYRDARSSSLEDIGYLRETDRLTAKVVSREQQISEVRWPCCKSAGQRSVTAAPASSQPLSCQLTKLLRCISQL